MSPVTGLFRALPRPLSALPQERPRFPHVQPAPRRLPASPHGQRRRRREGGEDGGGQRARGPAPGGGGGVGPGCSCCRGGAATSSCACPRPVAARRDMSLVAEAFVTQLAGEGWGRVGGGGTRRASASCQALRCEWRRSSSRPAGGLGSPG